MKDFRWWSSLPIAEINKGLEMVGSQLEQDTIDGLRYWFAPAGPYPVPAPPTVHLLQGFDEYVVAYSDSKYVVDASGEARLMTQGRVPLNLLIVLDSQIAGHWKRTVQNDSILIEVILYRPFDTLQTEALQAAADRHAAFLGRPAAVVRHLPPRS